ncbi:MAG: PEGA domain-containing protein [Bradymonadia bacterium]
MERLICLIVIASSGAALAAPADPLPPPEPAAEVTAEVASPVTPAPPALPQLTVRSRPEEAQVYAGLTPLGLTPLTVGLPEGRYPLAVYRPGAVPNKRPVRLESEGKTWTPAIRKAWPPTPWGWPDDAPPWATKNGCRGIHRCGLGAARGFSPVLTDTTALARAIVEVARDQQTTVGRLEKVYVESWGHTQATVLRQTTRWRVRPARFDHWTAPDGLAGWRIFGGRGGGQLGWPALGAGDALAMDDEIAQMARAEIGAILSAIRWQMAARKGVMVQARQGTFIDGDRDRLLFEDEATLTFKGTLQGANTRIELRGRLSDLQAITQKHDVPVGTEYQTTDMIQVTLTTPTDKGPRVIRFGVEAGVTRLIESDSDITPAGALKQLKKGLKAVGLRIEQRALIGEVNGVPVVRVVVGPGGKAPAREMRKAAQKKRS